MKINSVHLKNFGKHKDRRFPFDGGMTMLRGNSEAGKTTAALGAMYCLFGTSVLDFAVEHYVYDPAIAGCPGEEKPASLRVVVNFEAADGVEYVCSRGTSGAELIVAETKAMVATNHAPVTAKVEELLGVPPGKAETTLFAKQGKIQGILALGPTALAEYIEKLAGFDSVDALISDISSKLSTGSTKFYEEQLEQKKAQIAAVPAQVDVNHLKNEAEASEVVMLQKTAASQAAELMFRSAEQDNAKLDTQRKDLIGRIAEYKRQGETRGRLEADLPKTDGVAEKIAELDALIIKASKWLDYERFLAIPKVSEDVWEGDVSSLELEIAYAGKRVQDFQQGLAVLESNLKARKGSYLNTTVCPFTKETCDKLSDLGVIARTNAEIDAALAEMEKEKFVLQASFKEEQEGLADLESVLRFQTMLSTQLASHMNDIVLDQALVPWGVTWTSPVPEKAGVPSEDPEPLRELLRKAETIRGQLDVLPAPVDYSALEAELAGLALADVTGLKAVLSSALEELQAAVAKKRAAGEALEAQNRANALAQADQLRLQGEIAGIEDKLKGVAEDAAFLKAVKAARLVVAETLWSKVLAGTSRYFSLARGKDSTISRSAKGFLIDGHPIVSGSTFDLLGLALRITMSKLFAQCGIMILDESWSGADESRASLLLGMIAGSGFDQVIAITHRNADEGACDALITL